MPRKSKYTKPKIGCLGGKYTCAECARALKHGQFIIGTAEFIPYCLYGWRKQCHSANTFFVERDGSPYIRIPDEEAFAQKMWAETKKRLNL